MVSFADKFRKVVAANFVEISRPDSGEKEGSKSNEPATAAQPAPLSAPVGVNQEPETEPESAGIEEEGVFVTAAASEGAASALEAPESVSRSASGAPAEANGEMPTENPPREPAVVFVASAGEPEAASAEPEADPSDPMAFTAEDGAVLFDQIFAQAAVPSVTGFTAEQALSMLHSMPSDLPLRIKRLTVKATLDAVGQAVGATSTHIVNDASQKIATVEQFIRDISERATVLRDAEDREIARLKVLIAEKEAKKDAILHREEAVFITCREKIAELDQIVAFFNIGTEEAASASGDTDETGAGSEEADNDELPAYLQEDAVKRLLGLHNTPGASADDAALAPAREPDTIGARSPGLPKGR